MKIHLLSGFLGSGKTTAIYHACKVLMEQQTRVAVITNDQGDKLVDSGFINGLNVPGKQVVNGCFCCNYNSLENEISSLIETNNPEIIFAESVGSCTDIVATVLKPLQLHRPGQVTISTLTDIRFLYFLLKGFLPVFDESVNYIYYKQMEEAGIIVINKIDLVSSEKLDEVKALMSKKYPGKKLIYQNSLDKSAIQGWLKELDDYPYDKPLPSLQIDYDIYAAGEAKLAWYDEELEIESLKFNAVECSEYLTRNIYQKIKEKDLSIGHLKFLLNKKTKISFTATSDTNTEVNTGEETGQYASLLINARVQTEPEILSRIIDAVIEETEIQTSCTITRGSLASFQPGYPKPTHRIAD